MCPCFYLGREDAAYCILDDDTKEAGEGEESDFEGFSEEEFEEEDDIPLAELADLQKECQEAGRI